MLKKPNMPRLVGLLLCLLVIALLFVFKGLVPLLPFLVASPLMYLLFYFGYTKRYAKNEKRLLRYIIPLLIIWSIPLYFFFWKYLSLIDLSLDFWAAYIFGFALNLLIWGEKVYRYWK